MELFVWILVPAICALIGYSLMLYRSFACLVASGFAAYLGVWSEKLLFPFFEFLPSTQASSAGEMIAGAVIVFGVFAAIYTALNFDQNSYVFPLLIDSFGGALSGFFTGLIIIGFVGLTFCLATFNT
ncbi:MAG: hypothetical protein LBM70_05700, partial [Victivallales bacterium]|nr:hypothetical protein [Victivallales bacterium]